jgi:two-component system, NtrC family, sensor histidine kinase PilS
MKPSDQLQLWLSWIIKIRFVIITFVFAIEFALRILASGPVNESELRNFGLATILWYVLGLLYLAHSQLSHDCLVQAYVQICGDMIVITAIVHLTGNLASNFVLLYLLAIIMASSVLPRSRAFIVAAFCSVCMGTALGLAYLPGFDPGLAPRLSFLYRWITPAHVDLPIGTFEDKMLVNFFGIFAVAYLTSALAERLREARQELGVKVGEVASLQALTAHVIESMRGGVITTDLEGAILVVNPAGAALLGRDAEGLRGKPMGSVFDAGVMPSDSSPVASSAFARREISYACPNGRERVLGISTAPLIVPERGVVGYIHTFQDLTEQKRMQVEERFRDRMATLGRMAAGIAHEIRNPLSSISGSVKLLEQITMLSEDQAKLIGIVSRESARLDKLVSDFLVYSRDQVFEFRPVDLVGLLDETLLLLEHHPLFNSAFQVKRLFPPPPVLASIDTDKIRQVFWNVCNNSLKAMPDGGRLTAEIRNGVPDRVSVILSDTGIGLAASQMERVFEPFHSRFKDGTGLGLAISYQIVKAHGGEIHVSSRPGEGARFAIHLPRRQQQAEVEGQDQDVRAQGLGVRGWTLDNPQPLNSKPGT